MVRGRGGQTRGRGSQNMGTRGGRIVKNDGGRTNNYANLDFGFSSQTNNYNSPKPNRGGYNNSNGNSNNYNQPPQHQSNSNNNRRFSGGNVNSGGRYSGNNAPPSNNTQFSGNKPNQQRVGNNNQRPNRNQGPNQNYGGSNSNAPFNNNKNQGQNNYSGSNVNKPSSNNRNPGNQGYNQNQGNAPRYNNNQQNQNQDNSPRFNNNSNSNYPQRTHSIPVFSNDVGFNNDSFGDVKPSLLGSHPAISGPPARNEPSSDDILKEIGKVFLTSMTGAGGPNPGANPIMNMMQGSQRGPGGPPNPSPYDNFYNNGNQYTNFNPPMFQNYRGGYNNARGRGGNRGSINSRGIMGNRGGYVSGFRNNANRGNAITPNKRTPGNANAGVKKQPFKPKNNPNSSYNKGNKNPKSLTFKTLKYCLNQIHKDVDENSKPLAAFLRQTFYDLTSQDRPHFLLLSKIILKHKNVVKLLSYEVKNSLDKKFGEGNEEDIIKKKLDFLKEKKIKFLADYKAAFEDDKKIEEKEKIIDEAFPILTGQNFEDKHIPQQQDYAICDTLKEEDYIQNFTTAFIKSCYEKFFYRVNYVAMPSKSIQKRLNFEFDNGFLSHLIVDKVKLKTNAKLPPILAKYVVAISHGQRTRLEASAKSSIESLTKTNEHVQTDIADFIVNEKVSAEVLRDFADCIILFDKIATSVKFKLLKYTPYINLSPETKQNKFDEIVKTIYKGVLDILKNKVKTSEKKFVDLVKDEPTEGEESKDIIAAIEDDDEAPEDATTQDTKAGDVAK